MFADALRMNGEEQLLGLHTCSIAKDITDQADYRQTFIETVFTFINNPQDLFTPNVYITNTLSSICMYKLYLVGLKTN